MPTDFSKLSDAEVNRRVAAENKRLREALEKVNADARDLKPEIQALGAEVRELMQERDALAARCKRLELKVKLLEARETFCSDCFDKVARRGCWRCRVQRLERALEAIDIRCREGDPGTDWLPICGRIARAALAEEPT